MDTYSHPDFLVADSIHHFPYNYYVKEEVELKLNFGEVLCYRIETETQLNGQQMKADYYFNSELGFVKMMFYLKDESYILLEAIDYKNICLEN